MSRPVAVDVVAQVLDRVFVEPVRTGRLRRDGWPDGLAPLVAIGLAVYGLGLVGAVFGGLLRSSLPHDSADGFPPALFGVLTVMVTVVVALVCTGCLHAPWPLALTGAVLALVFVLCMAGWPDDWRALIVLLVAWILLAGFMLLRRRGRFAWWEYVVVQTILGAGVGVVGWWLLHPRIEHSEVDVSNLALLLLASVSLFALPTTIAAGVALTEVATSTSVWVVATVTGRIRPAVAAGLTLALGGLVLGVTAWRWWTSALPLVPHLIATAGALAVLAGSGLAWRLARADRGVGVLELVSSARLVAVIAGVSIALPIMLELALMFVQVGLRVAADAAGTSVLLNGAAGLPVSTETLRGIGSLLAVAGCIGAAVLLARRGSTRAPGLLAVVAVVSAVRGFGQLGWVPFRLSLDDLALVVVVLVVAAAAWWAARRTLSPARVEAIATALLLGLAIGQRELLADPLAWLLGGTAGVLLAFGLIWDLLTGAEDANADSARFPRPARALLVVANLALTMTVFGYNQVIVTAPFDLDGFVVEGADVIGTGLLLAGLWAVLAQPAVTSEGSHRIQER